MSNQDWNSLNDMEFELMLQDSMSNLLEEDIVQEVTPWRTAMNRILIGLALCTVTLNFLGLNYLLPAIGNLLYLLGFRSLRRENIWFGACWCITIVRVVYFFSWIILYSTIYHSTLENMLMDFGWIAVNVIVMSVWFFCLWKGFRAVQKKAGLPQHAGGAIALMVWNAFVCVLALIQYSGWIVMILMLICYVSILRSLFGLSKELDEAGYVIQTAVVKISDKALVTIIVGILAVGISGGYLFFNSYPMEWKVQELTEDDNIQTIQDNLINLGFPEEILKDLTEEDIRACEDALNVKIYVSDFPMNDGREVREETEGAIYITTVYDVEELRITGIAVEVPENQWKLFHHFQWMVDPNFYGTESIQLWPAYRAGTNAGWKAVGDVSGQVLYDKAGQTYIAPYYSLKNETYTYNNIFWGEQTSTDIFAMFSMPGNGENYRGYVSYMIEEIQKGWLIDAWINYTHQQSWMQYPVKTAKESRMSSIWDMSAFKTVQDAIQFHPSADEE